MKEGLTAIFVSIQNNNNVYLLHATTSLNFTNPGIDWWI